MADQLLSLRPSYVYNSDVTVNTQASSDQCCRHCTGGCCDIRIEHLSTSIPGCCLHTRCCPLSESNPLAVCPVCHEPVLSIKLLPMSFVELDQAQAEAAQTELSDKRGKKRQNATIARLQPKKGCDDNESPDLRTGRWTTEETAFCDELIQLFEKGKLPIPDGIKLNDFLSGMLKSKQARLTKKMKNAKLSSRQYRKGSGFIESIDKAREFSRLETDFFASIRCNMERSEIRFHMQKEWRELFSGYCVAIGQKLDADLWLSSVEEMDRRNSQQKDAARMARRKVMMGYALSEDAINQQHGVFIDPSAETDSKPLPPRVPSSSVLGQSSESDPGLAGGRPFKKVRPSLSPRPLGSYSSPFVGKVIHYMQRRNVPFEHVDAWVPSLVPVDGIRPNAAATSGPCRLCFAGCATADVRVPQDGGAAVPLSEEDQFDLLSFGVYSQKFSFDVGCGLPGRVYQSGIPSWEQGIANAPANLFERAGGAKQWGIQTVLGLPISSPNVGRIVVVFYSCFDRPRDDVLVTRMVDELTKMMPSPQWKLVVDVGTPPEAEENSHKSVQSRELLALVQTYTPVDKCSPLVEFLPGFTSLHLLLTDTTETSCKQELLKVALGFFAAYKARGIADKDAVWMTARDFMSISKNHQLLAGRLSSPASTVPMPEAGCPSSVQLSSTAPKVASFSQTVGASGPGVAISTGIKSDRLSQFSQPVYQTSCIQGNMATGSIYDVPVALSPALHPISSDMNPDLSTLGLGLSASQLAALLQADAAVYMNGS